MVVEVVMEMLISEVLSMPIATMLGRTRQQVIGH